MKALFDVNVLIALLDANHVHHKKSLTWLADHGHLGWSSCAITINGCVRIMSSPAYPNSLPAAQIIARLVEATQHSLHESLYCEVSLLNSKQFEPSHLLTSNQITDKYLLGLAVTHGHRLVTFDTRMSITGVLGASPQHLLTL